MGALLSPAIADLEKAFDEYKNGSFDLVVGVGGGSSMDMAKSIGVLLGNDGAPRDYLGVELVPKPGISTILAPTTSGTGAEATPNAIFSVPEEQVKLAIVSTHVIPFAAIVDPKLTLSAPPKVTSAAGVDAFHALPGNLRGQKRHPHERDVQPGGNETHRPFFTARM